MLLSLSDIDECASSPCENGGSCIDLNAEWTSSSSGFTVGYACQCMAGYTGEQCNTSRNFRFGSVDIFMRYFQISMNVLLRLVRTAEVATTELTSTRVVA